MSPLLGTECSKRGHDVRPDETLLSPSPRRACGRWSSETRPPFYDSVDLPAAEIGSLGPADEGARRPGEACSHPARGHFRPSPAFLGSAKTWRRPATGGWEPSLASRHFSMSPRHPAPDERKSSPTPGCPSLVCGKSADTCGHLTKDGADSAKTWRDPAKGGRDHPPKQAAQQVEAVDSAQGDERAGVADHRRAHVPRGSSPANSKLRGG